MDPDSRIQLRVSAVAGDPVATGPDLGSAGGGPR